MDVISLARRYAGSGHSGSGDIARALLKAVDVLEKVRARAGVCLAEEDRVGLTKLAETILAELREPHRAGRPEMGSTHTRTHVYVTFANPHLVCSECGQRATGFHDPRRCGEGDDGEWWNMPCRHSAEVNSTCPSWSPVDGCRCLEHLGHVPHAMEEERDE